MSICIPKATSRCSVMRELSHLGVTREGRALSPARGSAGGMAGMGHAGGEGELPVPARAWGSPGGGCQQKPCRDPAHPCWHCSAHGPTAGSEAAGQYPGAGRQQRLSLTRPQLSLVAHIREQPRVN